MNPNAPRRSARIAAPALAALALSVALAAPASASPSFVTRSANQVYFSALPGEVNDVTLAVDGATGDLIVTDTTSTLTPGPGCAALTVHAVRCGPAATVTRIQASLNDRNDRIRNLTTIASDLDGGAGDDIVVGGNGNDRLTDPDGWGSTPGETTFVGQGGNDTIVSRNNGFDKISCGPGFDLVVADSALLDTLVTGSQCEFVQR
ncbi:hypothetical protein OV450_2924 [Actinobacteria bacterium OV450]|nr:hypothetical protein OV450_2924 [Actinobacteria bacterium OV450]